MSQIEKPQQSPFPSDRQQRQFWKMLAEDPAYRDNPAFARLFSQSGCAVEPATPTLASAATTVIATEITTITEEPAVFNLEHDQEQDVLALFAAASGLTRRFIQPYVKVLDAAAEVTNNDPDDIPDYDSYVFGPDDYQLAARDAKIEDHLEALPVLQEILAELLTGKHAQEVYTLLHKNVADWESEHLKADDATIKTEEAKQYVTRANAAAVIVQTIIDLLDEDYSEEGDEILDENTETEIFGLLYNGPDVSLIELPPSASELLQDILDDIDYEDNTIDAIDNVTKIANERRELFIDAPAQLRQAVAQAIEPLEWGTEFLLEDTSNDDYLKGKQAQLAQLIIGNEEKEGEETVGVAREKLRGQIYKDIAGIDHYAYELAAFAAAHLPNDVLMRLAPKRLPENAGIDALYETAADNVLILLKFAEELQQRGIVPDSLRQFNLKAQQGILEEAIKQVGYDVANTTLLHTLSTLQAEVEHHKEEQKQQEKQGVAFMTVFEDMRLEANALLSWVYNLDAEETSELAAELGITPEELPAILETLGRDVNPDTLQTMNVVNALLQLRQAQNGEMPKVQLSDDTSFQARNEQIMASIKPFLESFTQGEPEWPSEEVRVMVTDTLEKATGKAEMDEGGVQNLLQILLPSLLRDLNLDRADQLDTLASFRASKSSTTRRDA